MYLQIIIGVEGKDSSTDEWSLETWVVFSDGEWRELVKQDRNEHNQQRRSYCEEEWGQTLEDLENQTQGSPEAVGSKEVIPSWGEVR